VCLTTAVEQSENPEFDSEIVRYVVSEACRYDPNQKSVGTEVLGRTQTYLSDGISYLSTRV